MTLPDERFRSIHYTREFLRDLLDPKKTPRVPREVRQQASRCLRHFPWNFHMEEAAKKCPDIFEIDKV